MTEAELRETLRRIRAGSIDAEQEVWDWFKEVNAPMEPLQCPRCGTVDAFGQPSPKEVK